MYDLVKKNKLLYAIALILIILYSSMDVAKSLLMSEIFDNEQFVDSVFSGIGLVLIFLLIYLFIMSIQQYVIELLKNKIRYDLNKDLYDVYLSMYPSEFMKMDSSEVINELNNEVNVIIEQYVSSKLNIFFLLISFLLGSAYIGFMSYEILCFLYVCGFSILLVNQLFAKKFKRNQKKMLESQKVWIKSIKNFCHTFKSIKNYALETKFEKVLDNKNADLKTKTVHSNGFMKVISSMNSGISQIMFFGTLLFGVKLIDDGILSVGKLIGIVQASNMVINPIINYVNLHNGIIASTPILKKFKEKIAYHQIDGTQELNEAIQRIDVRKLNFSYGDKKIFEDVSISFEKGKNYLIVGESGCGKSTLLEIIAKQINSDTIFINDKPLAELSFQSYVKHFSYLTQDSYLLPFSLEENITLGRGEEKNSVDDLLQVLYLNDLKEKKMNIYNIESPELSGGELQRISLGRALFEKREWMFLDEAFSALDEKNAINIETYILTDPDISVISISHKLLKDVVRLYDVVILMKEKSIETMSVDEYMKKYMESDI